nr:ARP2/3-S4 [Parasacculina yatsui]
MAATLKPYLNAINHTLHCALCLQNFSSQVVERHNKPEVEVGGSKELLLAPVVISRNEKERTLIEPSINSTRVSLCTRKLDDLEEMLNRKFMRFLMMRAENFYIMRRKPVSGYDISFLITSDHVDTMFKHKLVDFLIYFINLIVKDLNEMKLAINARARTCADEFMRRF